MKRRARRSERPLFDVYIMADWSAHNAPKTGKDSIWIAGAERRGRRMTAGKPINAPTRHEAMQLLLRRVGEATARKRRVLVGFDFSLGYPVGTAAALGRVRGLTRWRSTWTRLDERIQDDARNRSNRFEVAAALNERIGHPPGPFWACPTSRASRSLTETRQRFPFAVPGAGALAEYRLCERAMRQSKLGVHSVWKLYTAGSVGSQALLGIPYLMALRDWPALRDCSAVWPFETGFTATPSADAQVVYAEIWPGIVAAAVGRRLRDGGPVKDALQVSEMCRWLAAQDDAARLAACFDRPQGLTARQARDCEQEEGWILGVSAAPASN